MLRAVPWPRREQGDEEAFAALVREVGDRCIFIARSDPARRQPRRGTRVQVALVQVWRELPPPCATSIGSRRGSIASSSTPCYAEARRGRHFAAGRRPARRRTHRHAADEVPDGPRPATNWTAASGACRRSSAPSSSSITPSGCTVPEVADHLGIPLGTAKSRLSYATTAIRAALEADARTPSLYEEVLA